MHFGIMDLFAYYEIMNIMIVWITRIFLYNSRSRNVKATILTGYFIATENLKQ